MKKTYLANHNAGETEPFVYSWTEKNQGKEPPSPLNYSNLPDHLKPSEKLNASPVRKVDFNAKNLEMSKRPEEPESWAPRPKNINHLNQSLPNGDSAAQKPTGKMKIIDDHFMRRSEAEFSPRKGKRPFVERDQANKQSH